MENPAHYDENYGVQKSWEPSYIRCAQLNMWIDKYSQGYNKQQIYEFNSCITRYFISLSLEERTKQQITSLESGSTGSNHIHDKFLQELVDKKLCNKFRISIEHFEDISHETNLCVPASFDVDINSQSVSFVCGSFNETITRDRYEILRAFSSDENILCMLLRYTTFSAGSFGWQVPLDVYRCLYEKHGLTIEGCASPINSQMQLLCPFRGKYCSPFKEDSLFGSIGNIFDISINGETILINPPFVEDFMLFLVEWVIEELEKVTKPTVVILVVPAWTDAQSHIILNNCKWLNRRFDLSKGTYSYEEPLGGNKIKAKFNSTVFVLTQKVDSFDISDAIALFHQQ